MAVSSSHRQGRWLPAGVALALATVTLFVYLPVRHCAFLNWDDLTYLEQNDHVRSGFTWEGVGWAFTHSYSSNWHPVTWLSHMLDCQLYGLNPAGHHLTNLGFHTANAVLLFLLLRRLTGTLWRSGLVAALFALHPLHVESVAWVAERKDVLSTFFFMLTLWAYARYVSGRKCQASGVKGRVSRGDGREPRAEGNPKCEARNPKGEDNPAPSIQHPASNIQISSLWYCLALFLFALGLMSKPMLVTLPFVLLLLDYWPLRFRISDFGFRIAAPVLFKVQGSTFDVQRSTFGPLLLEKWPFFVLSAVSCVITVIVQKKGGAVASFEMLPLGARLENAAVAYVQYLARFFWPAGLSPLYPHPKHWALWQVAGAVTLLTFLTLAAWRTRRRFPFALTGWLWFLGTLVPVIGIVQVGSQAFADRYTYIPLVGIMLAVVWLAAEALLEVKQPLMETNGHERGSAEVCARKPEAEQSQEIRVHSCSFVALLAVALPVVALALLGWRTWEQLAFWQDTGTLFGRALALDPNNVQALYGLGSALVDKGRIDEGKRFLEKAIRLQPQYPEVLGTMGNLLDGQGDYGKAIQFYEAALRAQPNQAGVLNNLAWLRASCVDPAFRDGAEAVRLGSRACDLTDYTKPLFVGTLAAAQAEAGDFQSAIGTAERAEALARKLRLDDIAAKNRELIGLYRLGKAAHGGPPR